MAGEALTLNGGLSLVDSTAGLYLMEHAYPPPAPDILWASSADTEGELAANLRYKNREITVKLRVFKAAGASIVTLLGTLGKECDQVNREGGTLARTLPTGEVITFDLVAAEHDIPFDNRFVHSARAEVTLKFTAKPFGRGTEVDAGDNSTTTDPVLIFTEASLKGDVPGTARLVIDEDQGVDQSFLAWGVQSRYYSSAATAALFYEAEGRTALGAGAATAVLSGASGAGSNTILANSLTNSFQAILSTQATGGGAHLTHVGSFRVWARVQVPTANTGDVQVALEWSQGDFRVATRNTVVSLYPDAGSSAYRGQFRFIDLGLVHVDETRWEGRILAKSTVTGDDIYVDHICLFPVNEGYGESRAVLSLPAPSTYAGRDEFDQSAGALTGKTAAVGGVWAGAGDADDFSVETTGKTAQRTAVSDANSGAGRFAVSGASAMTNTVVQVDMKSSIAGFRLNGPIARYVDSSNYLLAGLRTDVATNGKVRLAVNKVIAGSFTELGAALVDPPAVDTYWTARLRVDVSGQWYLWWWQTSLIMPSTPVALGQDSALATGGTLDDGKPGFYDVWTAATANTRNYDNFQAWAHSPDAAVMASQSVEVSSEGCRREDSAGSYWVPSYDYTGDNLLVPPAGPDGRTARFIVKLVRNHPELGADAGIDDVSAKLFYTPRYLVVPEP